MSNFDKVIKQLNNISDSLVVECPIVSTHSTSKCRQLSVNQQKQLIKNATGAAIDTIKISNIINKIIVDNTDAKDINAIDKEGILLAMKSQTVQNTEEQQNISKVLQALGTIDIAKDLHKTVTNHGITLSLSFPTIERDSAINSEFIEQFKDKQLSNTEVISQYFVYETIKYIESFSINGETISFAECSNVKDFALILTHMPSDLVAAASNFANEVKGNVNKIFAEYNVPLQTSSY